MTTTPATTRTTTTRTTTTPTTATTTSGDARPTDNVQTLLRVAPWWEPELAITGFDPRGPYVERYWLPVLGPASTLALRWFARRLAENPTGFSVPVPELARCLGLGAALSRNAPAPRSIERLTYFGLARSGDGSLAVRTHVPALGAHLLRRLPPTLRDSHPGWLLRHEGADGPGHPGPTAA